jgi:hypothetical protein
MRWPRVLLLTSLMGLALLFAACSYSTDFVVVNKSNQPIEIIYKVKKTPGPLASVNVIATADISAINSKERANWKQLSSTQYQLDQANGVVTVRLEAGKALRVTTMFHYFGHDDPQNAANFPIEYMNLTGPNGSLTLSGDQARVRFSKVSRVLYTLTYN